MKKQTKGIEKLKNIINYIKEAWKNPRKKAAIKLFGYFLFFLSIFVIAGIGNSMKLESINANKVNGEEEVEVDSGESYSDKQNYLKNNNHNVNYEIKINDNVYKIEGTIKDGILEGYLEETTGIKKIILKENVLYEIKNGNEIPLVYEINLNKIDLNYLVGIFEQNNAYIDTTNKEKNYQYAITINDIENRIIVYTNENSIYKIVITDNISEYILNFDN